MNKPKHNTKSYSLDLRKRAIELFKEGKTYIYISTLLKVSMATLGRWKNRASLEAFPRGGTRPKDIGVDLLDLIAKNPGKSAAEISKGLPISSSTLSRRFAKAKISFKKISYTYKEASPEKQKEFLQDIASIATEKIYSKAT